MGEISGKRIPLEKLTVPMIYEHLKSKNVIDNLYQDILAQIKETPCYRRIKEVAVTHMTEILTDPSKAVPCPEDRVGKKKQIAEIGLLALSIDSSMCQIVSDNLGERTESLVNNALKELLGSEKKQPGMLTRSPKRSVLARPNCSNRIVPEYSEETYNKSINAILESDNESNTSIDKLSVSSVHTSDLSSFDDEIELSDKEDGIKRKKVPLKSVNKLMLNKKFSNVHQRKEMDQETEAHASKSFAYSKRSRLETPVDSSRRMLSKRIRKPNSKYTSADMLLLDAVHPRQKELLDVQRDLNIINGTNAKLGESLKTVNRKRKAN